MDTRILALQHVEIPLPNNGLVLVLNTGAIITPEAEAMLQALHSRSVGGVREHLKSLAEKGAEKFMQSFYVGYGHKSIGDCGTTTIFIEGVSMLVAKAVQDWLLYSGQEASTRYINFSNQPFINPVDTSGSGAILEAWRGFYLASQEPVRAHLRALFPRNADEDEKTYEKAINARSFDILRGFLPAGASTNLAWHTNLRQAADHMAFLRHHPLYEVRVVAAALEDALKQAHPSSFEHKRYQATEAYNRTWMEEQYYFHGNGYRPRVMLAHDGIDRELLKEYRWNLRNRPAKTELPKQVAECGSMRFEFMLDFGSFRDIQRQRSVVQRMPLLTSNFGMHPWYTESLPEAVRHGAGKLVQQQLDALASLALNDLEKQYFLPMGMLVPCRLTGDLAALAYVTELRAQSVVHPTLHEIALGIADILLEKYGAYGLTLNVDRAQGRFDVKRGLHDIVQRD